MSLIHVKRGVSFKEESLEKEYMRSGGPGGQNVNKVETGVRIKLPLEQIEGLSSISRDRLEKLFANKIRNEKLIAEATSERTQYLNYRRALNKIIDIIREAATIPKSRIKTKPSQLSQHKRIEEKKKLGEKKQNRRNFNMDW